MDIQSAYRVVKKFNIKKAVFLLLLLDCIWSSVFCLVMLAYNLLMFTLSIRNYVVCTLTFASSGVSAYQGVVIALLIAVIRYYKFQIP